MSLFEFMECALAAEDARPTKQQYVSSSGEDIQSFGSKMTLNGLPPLYIPGKKGGFIDILIAYIESTENFFCQLQDQGDVITKMSDDMAKFYSDGGHRSKPLVNPLPGTLCAAKYSADNCWYRGFVLNRPRPTIFDIYFIDYGNVEMVHLTDLRILSNDFSNLPPRAFRCSMKNVPNDQPTNRRFKEKTDGQKLVLKLENAEASMFSVTLFDFDPATRQECNINDLLNGDTHSENNNSLTNGYALTNGNAAKEQPNLHAAEMVPDRPQNPMEVSSNEQKSLENIEPVIIEQRQQLTPKIKNFLSFQVPSSKTVDVFLVHAVSFNEFYLHLTSRFDDLELMTTKLQEFCRTTPKTLPKGAVKLGTACATIFLEDGCFYRCVPIEIKNNLVKVHFVDYGNEQIVNVEQLYELSDELIEQPCFSVKCCLDTLKVKEENDFDEQDIKNDFDSLAIEEKTNEPMTFECSFLSNEEPCLVSLKRNGEKLEDLLISMGHCEKIINIKESRPSSSSTLVKENIIQRFPSFRLPQNKTQEAYISVAITPAEFYVHLAFQADDLDRMTMELQKFCRKKAQKLSKEKLQIGTACAAIYSLDSAFYRCTIVAVKDDSVDIYFIDYGNHENVPIESLFELSQNFIEQPCFAARCCVISIKPSNGSETFDPSIKDDIDALAVDSRGEIQTFSCGFLTDEEPYLVSLTNNRGESFEDLLIKMGHCELVSEIGENEKVEISHSGFQGDSGFDNKFETFSHATWPQESPICEVFISCDVGPDELYIQKFDTIDEFSNFAERLQKFLPKCPSIDGDVAKIGAPYAAVFFEDGQFYRCVPVEFLDDGNVKVQFVDYGNFQTMPVSKLHTFPIDDSDASEFLSTPRFVVEARLLDVRPAESATSYGENATDFIDNYAITEDCNPKKLICKIIDQKLHNGKLLYDVEIFHNGKSLADELIENSEH